MDLHTKTNDNGTIKLNYTVSDGNGAEVKATNSFELEAVNDAPRSKPINLNIDTDEIDTATVSLAQLLSGYLMLMEINSPSEM